MFSRLTQLPISLRLPALVVAALAISLAAASTVYYRSFQHEQLAEARAHAESDARRGGDGIDDWLADQFRLVADLAEGHLAPSAIRAFNEALALQTSGWLDDLHQGYVTDNPNPPGARADLDRGTSRPAYDAVHERFHSFLHTHLDRFAYYDLFLITPRGEVIYTVQKEADFGTNLDTGPYADTALARVWRMAVAGDAAATAFVDFEPYAPSNGAPAAFLARQVRDVSLPDSPLIGIVAIQIPHDDIALILETSSALNPLDEIYLLGDDGLARSPGRLDGTLAMLSSPGDLAHVTAAGGETMVFDNVTGLHGRPVLAAVSSFETHGERWSVVVELDRESTFAALTEFGRTAILFTVIGIVVSLIIGFLVARSIIRPLLGFQGSMQRIAAEDYDSLVIGCDRRDEIGTLSRGLDQFRGALKAAQDADALQAQARIEQERVVADLGRGLRDLASGQLDGRLTEPYAEGYEQLRADFNETVDTMESLMRGIARNASEIRARAEEISASSDDLSHRTENQAATLEETAAALDELTASVRAAAESASEVERVVADARKEAEKSGQVVAEAVTAMSMIRKSSTEISQIIGVIDDIAFQTNLLALNAGVEAARAGDAGRGFAVVASEVRALAQRSSEAAKQIKTLITGSAEQVETGVGLVGRAGETLGMIIERVGNIDHLVGGIATGAREQSSGLGEINVGVSQLDQVTQQNAAMVEQVSAAAMTLKNESAALSQIVARFRVSERSEQPLAAIHEFTPTPAPVLSVVARKIERAEPAAPMVANMARWQDF